MITINLSQSALSYHGCILELKRTVIDGYYDTPSSNIVYGEGIHKYRHIMFQTKGHIPTARDEALKTFRQPKIDKKNAMHLSDEKHMICSAFNYWELCVKADTDLEYVEIVQDCWKCGGKGTHPLTPEFINNQVIVKVVECPICKGTKQLSGPATEVSFSIPYYQDDHIQVNLCGTLDGLGKIRGGCYVIPDLKTTSSWDKRAYFGTYKLSRQLRFYILALKLMHKLYPDSILGQIGGTNVGARIDALFLKPMPNDNTWASSEVFTFPNDDIEAFQSTIDALIQKLSAAVKNNYWPKEGILNSSCIGKWGLCQFANVCSVSNDVAEVLLKRDFKVKPFTPLNYSGL